MKRLLTAGALAAALTACGSATEPRFAGSFTLTTMAGQSLPATISSDPACAVSRGALTLANSTYSYWLTMQCDGFGRDSLTATGKWSTAPGDSIDLAAPLTGDVETTIAQRISVAGDTRTLAILGVSALFTKS